MKKKVEKKGAVKGSKKERIIALVIVVFFITALLYFFISSEKSAKGEIPPYVWGETRAMYEFAKSKEGSAILEQLPCYCGCKYEGHKHARHCFWRDDGTFDKHGITCSVCLDIAKKAKEMYEQEKSVCEIRKEIDKFYLPNAELATETPMPVGCG